MMKKLSLNLICLCFSVKPEIKASVGKELYPVIVKEFKEQFIEIDNRTKKEKGIMAFHRTFNILGLSLYNSLIDRFSDQEELIGIIHDILWKGPMNKMVRFFAFFIRRSRDPFRRYLQILGPNNEWFFPCPPWEKVSVDLHNGIGWHQMKCPYKEFFIKEGVIDLTRAYCDMDRRIAELLPDHIELKRQHSLAKGDLWCDFLYYKK